MIRPDRILITGAGGFIGGAVARTLEHAGQQVLALDRKVLDLTQSDAVMEYVGRLKDVRALLHFASRGVQADANDISLVEEEYAIIKALCTALPQGARIFYAGSMSEYGRSGILHEDLSCKPQTSYARAKLEAGLWLRRYAPDHGITPIVGRIFGAYGPGEPVRRLLPSVISALEAGQSVDLSDGRQIRDFIHVRDIADLCARLISAPTPPECVNIGTGVGLQVRDVITRLGQEFDRPFEDLRFGARHRSPHDLEIQVAATDRLAACLGSVPPQRLSGDTPLLPLMSPAYLRTPTAGAAS